MGAPVTPDSASPQIYEEREPAGTFGSPDIPRVLFRFPGACGIRDFLQGSPMHLARRLTDTVYFARANFGYTDAGTRLFGSLLVFAPARFQVVATDDPAVWIGTNAGVTPDRDLTWIPPRLAIGTSDWQAWDTPARVHALIGPTMQEERRAMAQTLASYFEEVQALIQSQLPLPDQPWYQVPISERQHMLNHIGMRGRWSQT